jgi:hypothetical protein
MDETIIGKLTDMAARDNLAALNRFLNAGKVDAIHRVSGRAFSTEVDDAGPEDDVWEVDAKQEAQALSLLQGTGAEQQSSVIEHKVKNRSDPLNAVIEKAKSAAADREDFLSVWAALVNLAKSASRPAPLLGYEDLEGIKYEVLEQEGPAYFTKDALRKRMNRKARSG